jgi:hypothetical protein
MDKKISYLARDFEDIKKELITFSEKYYPKMSSSYDDKSVGAWFIDLCSAVGDSLSYSIDRAYQETQMDSANLRSTLLNIARENGVKIPGPKASLCEVRISCVLPLSSGHISEPDWNYAPTLKRASRVSCGNNVFELQEDVNFKEQFNSDGYGSNRDINPRYNSNGIITAYTITKTTVVVGGTSKIYKKTILQDDINPFMEVILPDKNIMNIEGIIFKGSSSYNKTPNLSEFYVSDEEFRWADESIYTYKYFETDSLADQYIFGSKMSASTSPGKSIVNGNDIYNCGEIYDTYSLSGDIISHVYKGEWKAVRQKYITEYTDQGYLKIIFGSGVDYETVPSADTYSRWQMSKIVNNDMLGVLPSPGWIMYVLYKVGNGSQSNVAAKSINTINWADIEWSCANSITDTKKNAVVNSMTVTNLTSAVGGKDAPSIAEIKYLVKYNSGSQGRCVTIKDYKAKLMSMPPKYGCPFRASVSEENNKVVMNLLGIDYNGNLSERILSTTSDNIKEYMKMYKNLGDYIELKSGKVINVGFIASVFIDKNYTANSVVKEIINEIQAYMDINIHDMGDDIFIGDLEKEITLIDGVISIIDFEVYNLYDSNGNTYGEKSTLPQYIKNESPNSCDSGVIETFPGLDSSLSSFRIDIDSLDSVLASDENSMFEIKNPQSDIKIRVKLR